jgi:hypothetical protein
VDQLRAVVALAYPVAVGIMMLMMLANLASTQFSATRSRLDADLSPDVPA